MTHIRHLLTAALLLVLSLPALAQDTLTYQGSLQNAVGEPVTASLAMTFSIYSAAEEGEALWTESYESVEVLDGTFTVELGSNEPFGEDLANNEALFLGIAVNGAPEMAPRMKVSSALRARWAAHAKDVRGEDIHPNSVSINDTEVINSDGQWVGDAAGLRGETGPQGLPGEPGTQGEQGPAGPGFDVTLDTDTDGFTDWLEVMVGTDPTDDSSVPADADADNIPDSLKGPRGNDGTNGSPGSDGLPGADGVSVNGASMNDAGELILSLSAGDPINVGVVIGADGSNGVDGADGADGATIQDAEIDENGQLKLYMSDMRLITATGTARGPAGSDGVGVTNLAIDNAGDLIVTLSNGNDVNAGRARGVDGQDAANQSPLTDLFNESPRSAETPTAIPRASNQGADSILDINYNGVITQLSVVVDITHPDTTQLELLLIAPNGASYLLYKAEQGSTANANMITAYPDQTSPIDALDTLIGQPASGRFILRAIDRDLGNEQADRIINSWGLNLERKADDAYRLRKNLVVDGAVQSETNCQIQPLVVGNEAVPGVVTLKCGSQDPIRLSTFQCGNAQVDPGEFCDDGNLLNDDGCDNRCVIECGNGFIDGAEACDEGAANSDAPNATCRSNCTQRRCGDGVVDTRAGEACDEGAGNSDAPSATCRTDCQEQRCGDGIVDQGEFCDEGAANSDAPNASCRTNCTTASATLVHTGRGQDNLRWLQTFDDSRLHLGVDSAVECMTLCLSENAFVCVGFLYKHTDTWEAGSHWEEGACTVLGQLQATETAVNNIHSYRID